MSSVQTIVAGQICPHIFHQALCRQIKQNYPPSSSSSSITPTSHPLVKCCSDPNAQVNKRNTITSKHATGIEGRNRLFFCTLERIFRLGCRTVFGCNAVVMVLCVSPMGLENFPTNAGRIVSIQFTNILSNLLLYLFFKDEAMSFIWTANKWDCWICFLRSFWRLELLHGLGGLEHRETIEGDIQTV